MAEFSEEYYECRKEDNRGDFSIEKLFNRLKDGQHIEQICEGYGFVTILNKDDECYLGFSDGSYKSDEEVLNKKIEKKDNYRPLIYIILGIVGVWITFWLCLVIYYDYGQITDEFGNVIQNDSSGDRGTFGDMFGGVNALFSGIAMAGVIYAIFLQKRELRLQRHEIRDTRKEFVKQNEIIGLQQFENTFFKMINLHHEIIEKLSLSTGGGAIGMSVIEPRTYNAREMLSQTKEILFRELSIKTDENQNIDLSKYKETDVDTEYEIIDTSAWSNIQESYYYLYYEQRLGVKLSHYYRNIYHIFKFIYKNKVLSDPQKQEYASIARSQLSQDELFLLFYNSMYIGHGNPKFLFLIKTFDVMQNFDYTDLKTFESHQEIFNSMCDTVQDCLDEKDPEAIYPDVKYLDQKL